MMEKAEEETSEALTMMRKSSYYLKNVFLKSFVENHNKHVVLTTLDEFFCFYKDSDSLEPSFYSVAKVFIDNKDYCSGVFWNDFYDWINIKLESKERLRVAEQLLECGVIDCDWDFENYTICLKNVRQLKYLWKKANGRSLLSVEDKLILDDFSEKRSNEIYDSSPYYVLPILQKGDSYENLVDAYGCLDKCNRIWESAETTDNQNVNRFVENKHRVRFWSGDCFNYVRPFVNGRAIYFRFENIGIDLYLYPYFVVIAKSNLDFRIIDIKEFNIEFRRGEVVHPINDYSIPNDAKLIGDTYKYVRINGEIDSRYSNNPKCVVYEYADLFFIDFGVSMQFSNYSVAKNFYEQFLNYRKSLENEINVRGLNKLYEEFNRILHYLHSAATLTETDLTCYGISQSYFISIVKATNELMDFYQTDILNDDKIQSEVLDLLKDCRSMNMSFLMLVDVLRCYDGLDHPTSLNTPEGIAILVVLSNLLGVNRLQSFEQLETVPTVILSLTDLFPYIWEFSDLLGNRHSLFLSSIIEPISEANDRLYRKLLYKLSKEIASVDGEITLSEQDWLNEITLLNDDDPSNDIIVDD